MSHIESLWRPSASIASLKQRAGLLADIRLFFTQRGYLEVETPIMGRFGITDVYLSNIQAYFRGKPYYLQTSPEYPMKRLLAAGSGPIFQLARVFRDDELGRWHNPEFTMLEWYQLGIDHHALMQEVDLFLQHILKCQPLVKKTYQHAFIEHCRLDPLQATISELKAALNDFNLQNVLPEDEDDKDQYLFLLMSDVVERALAKESTPIAIYDFPISQAALAKAANGVAERFEIYYKGVELANGFHELTDMAAQNQRFDEDLQARQAKNLPLSPKDEYLLAALGAGLPPCSGVALGIDRLIALALNKEELAQAMAFDFSRA